MTKRTLIETDEIGSMDDKSILLQPGVGADEMAVVTEASMQSKEVQEYTQELAFMEEMVTFSVGDSGRENESDYVECAVNGEYRRYKKNISYTDKRKFLNALFNVCWTTDTKIKKGDDNLDQTHVIRKPYSAYNISIQKDPSPLATRWLEYKKHGDMHVSK